MKEQNILILKGFLKWAVIRTLFLSVEYVVGGPNSVMVIALNCRIVVSEVELKSSYYIHFRTNTLGKGMNPLVLPAMG